MTEFLLRDMHIMEQVLPALTADRFGRAGMAYHFDNGGNVEIPYTAALNPTANDDQSLEQKSTAGRTINTDTYTLFAMNRWNGYKFQYQSANKIFFTVKGVSWSRYYYL